MTTKRPGKGWWFAAIILLLCFIVLQLPAAWIVSRAFPNNSYLDGVSGNLWQGQADWHYQQVQGVVHWRWAPMALLRLRLGANLTLSTGNTEVTMQANGRSGRWELRDLKGKISADTLRAAFPWQWPDSPILLKSVQLGRDPAGWSLAEGALSWGGGTLGYPMEGRVERAALPPLQGALSLDKQRLHLALTTVQNERMGDIYLAPDSMLDIQLTQRLLQTVAGYHGQAGLDTAVVSTRQPLASLGIN